MNPTRTNHAATTVTEPVHLAEALEHVLEALNETASQEPTDERSTTMSSTRVAINRVVLAGRAVTDPVSRTVKTTHGETTLTTFSIRTAKDTYVGSVIMEIHAWSRAAAQATHIKKGRTVAVDGQLTQHEFLNSDGKRQTRTSVRAERLQLIDDSDSHGD